MAASKILPFYRIINEEIKPPKIKKINQYLLVYKLGIGYFSKVYLALNQGENNSYCAAKAIHIHESFLNSKTLEREIKLLKILDHPNIVKLHTVLYAPSTDMAYMMMEWANCGTLQQAITNNFKFDERTIASIFFQIAQALAYLHSNGIVHRDVKPSNILLFSDGTAKLSDFGISHFEESAESVCGSPLYQAPDLFEGVYSDLFESLTNSYENEDFDIKIIKLQKTINFKMNNKKALTTEISKNNKKANKINNIITEKDKKESSKNKDKKEDIKNNNKTYKDDSDDEKNNNLHIPICKATNHNRYIYYGNIKSYKNNNHNINHINNQYSIGVENNLICTSMHHNDMSTSSSDTYEKENRRPTISTKNDDCRIDPKKGDVWSLGISLYQTVFGVLPYKGRNVYEIVNNINNSKLIIPENKYSTLFNDLIKKMLKKNPSERLSMDEVINHPFFVRFLFSLQDYHYNSHSNLILTNNNKAMKKTTFNIKPFQPPNCDDSQIVYVNAIICHDNYEFCKKSSNS